MTLEEIVEELKKLYPDAVAVELFVNESEYEVRLQYRTPASPDELVTTSMKRLDGSWVKF